MKPIAKWALGALGALVVVAGGTAWFSRGSSPWGSPAEGRGIALCAGPGARPSTEMSFDQTLFASVALSLSDGERTRLEHLVDEANTRWERRANPLFDDFDEGQPDDALEQWLAEAPASVLTAFTASAGRFCATDGFCVEPVMPSAPCPPGLARPATKAEHARARFLAWPFGYAVWLRAETEDGAEKAAEALRRASRASQRIALVVHMGDAERTKQPPFAELRKRFTRHETLKRIANEGDAGADDDASSRLPLHLDARDVLVLPRLGAITAADAIEAEVHDMAPALRVFRVVR